MDRFKDFTYDHDKWARFPEYVDELHKQNLSTLSLLVELLILTVLEFYDN